jgi:hypothetical protein
VPEVQPCGTGTRRGARASGRVGRRRCGLRGAAAATGAVARALRGRRVAACHCARLGGGGWAARLLASAAKAAVGLLDAWATGLKGRAVAQ